MVSKLPSRPQSLAGLRLKLSTGGGGGGGGAGALPPQFFKKQVNVTTQYLIPSYDFDTYYLHATY